MPCNLVVLNRVDLGKASGPLLEQAMKDLGFEDDYGSYRHRLTGAAVEIRGSELVSKMPRQELAKLANRVRVAYSKQVLARTAAVTGWTVQPTGKSTYVMRRR